MPGADDLFIQGRAANLWMHLRVEIIATLIAPMILYIIGFKLDVQLTMRLHLDRFELQLVEIWRLDGVPTTYAYGTRGIDIHGNLY